MERENQVILNMLIIKYIDNKVFDHIDPWGETLAYMAWAIRASYHSDIMNTPDQYFFVRDMTFNNASVADWRFVTAANQLQVEIDIV